MSIYRPRNEPPRQNEDISDVTILTPGGQPVVYEWNDNNGTTKVQVTPNPNAGDDRTVRNDQ